MIIQSQKHSKFNFSAQFNAKMQENIMRKARMSAFYSSCPMEKVGAVVTSDKGRVIGRGFTTIPYIDEGCGTSGTCPRIEFKMSLGKDYPQSCFSIPAEIMAISETGLKTNGVLKFKEGATLFVYGENFLKKGVKMMLASVHHIKDVYIQKDLSSPIRHISREDMLKDLNEEHLKDIELIRSQIK